MPYYFTVEGIGEIKCDTIEELKQAAGDLAGTITEVGADPPKKRGNGRPKKRIRRKVGDAKSPGTGPKRSWAVAQWYAVKTGVTRNDARSTLSDLRKGKPKEFIDLTEEFELFVQFYTGKIKATSIEQTRTALDELFDANPTKYKAAIDEYERKRKKADA